MNEAWFSALGEALGEDERGEIAAYLAGLGMDAAMHVRPVKTWDQAGELCRKPSDDWWRAEEDERARLERGGRALQAPRLLIRSCASTTSTAAGAGRSASTISPLRSSRR